MLGLQVRITVQYRYCIDDTGEITATVKNREGGYIRENLELEPTLGGGNGSHRAHELFPPPRVGSNGRSGEVARVKAFFPRVKKRRLVTRC